MKTISQWLWALAVLATMAVWPGAAAARSYYGGGFGVGIQEMQSELAIHADGSCQVSEVAVESRAMAEQQIKMMERYEKEGDNSPDDDEATAPKPPVTNTNAVKTLTDDELVKKITAMMDQENEDTDQKASVVASADKVTITTLNSYASLEEMLKGSYSIWNSAGLQLQDVRLETDTNGLLRVTLIPQPNMERYFKNLRSALKLSGMKSELKLVFPGRVVTSGFPATQTNSTWLVLDAKQDSSFDMITNLYAAPTVITAEAGGLKLDQPLEMRKLMRSARVPGAGAKEEPITDAGPGFVAEAQSVTTTTLHVFPSGEEYYRHNMTATGAVVSVKLFAPKGRTLKSVSNPKVLTAVDDQGRSVVAKPAAEDGDEDDTGNEEFSGGGSQAGGPIQIQLRLQLPQADARSIEQLSAEAVAVTVGTWKEMTLTNLQASDTNELDLGAVLPGAKLVITKLSAKNQQFTIQAKLSGPAAIEHLEMEARVPGNDEFNGSSYDRQSHIKGAQSSRTLQITGYGFNRDAGASVQSLVLKVRFPEDLRRERVKFELKGLDLL